MLIFKGKNWTDKVEFSQFCCCSFFSLKKKKTENLRILVIGMTGNKLADPVSGSHQFAVRSLLDQPQILVDRTVRIGIHFHAVQIAADQRQ